MRCPRCSIELPFRDLVRHLWLAHGLLFDGSRARPPWAVLRDQVAATVGGGDLAGVVRCYDLASRLDPLRGPARVQTLLARLGWPGTRHCPRCQTPLAPSLPLPPPLEQAHGRLFGDGFAVDVDDTRLTSRLIVTTPTATLWCGPEPGRRWSDRGRRLLVPGVLLAVAVVLALVLRACSLPAEVPTSLLLSAALGCYVLLRLGWPTESPPEERAIDYAWTWLVPQLQAGGWPAEAWKFIARLARTSAGRGHGPRREVALRDLVRHLEPLSDREPGALPVLTAAWRLLAEDALTQRRDPIRLVLEVVQRALSGEVPWLAVGLLLEGWESPIWTPGNLARLRLLVCEYAFAEGLQVGDLIALGHLCPSLGEVLRIDSPTSLVRLRWLSQAHDRPWENVGPGVTAYEIAGYPDLGASVLGRDPDLLLAAGLNGAWHSDAALIRICEQGVIFADTLMSEPRDVARAIPRLPPESRSPAVLQTLEAWIRYHALLVRSAEGPVSYSGAGLSRLKVCSTLVCSRCQLRRDAGRVSAAAGRAAEALP
ncbi:MAG: hypothetical protein NZ700_06725 [Gemmataceae bacterium]|nr:hypothetical protein [Gemmataceae bacterium]MDW8263741.1 hypothetical protein [Gemmataceae bacterium]